MPRGRPIKGDPSTDLRSMRAACKGRFCAAGGQRFEEDSRCRRWSTKASDHGRRIQEAGSANGAEEWASGWLLEGALSRPRRGATDAVVPDGVRVPTRVPMFHQVVCRIACSKVTPSAQMFLPMRLNGTPPLAVGRGGVGQRDRSRARGRQRGAGLGADTGGALLWRHTASCRHVVPFSIADVTRAPEDRHVVVDDGGSELRCTRRPGRLTSPRRRDHGPTGRAGRPGSCGL